MPVKKTKKVVKKTSTTPKPKKTGTNLSGIKRLNLPKEVLRSQTVLDLWLEYEDIRRSGKYNMITEAETVAEKLNLDLRQYAVLQKYWGQIRKMTLILSSIGDDIYYDLD